MYSLDVNFLHDRGTTQFAPATGIKQPAAVPGDMTPIFIGAAIALFFPALAGASLWFLQTQNTELERSIAQLELENQRLESEIGSINKIKLETNTIKSQTQALVSVFDQIRPWSAMLQELRDRIPAKVQIEGIRQTAPQSGGQGEASPNPNGGIEITGFARSFSDVNDFLLTIRQSRLFHSSDAKIISAELIDAPVQTGAVRPPNAIAIKPIQVVKYTIQSNLSDIPASELMRELEQKGTVGLVARIRGLQKTGVIQK